MGEAVCRRNALFTEQHHPGRDTWCAGGRKPIGRLTAVPQRRRRLKALQAAHGLEALECDGFR